MEAHILAVKFTCETDRSRTAVALEMFSFANVSSYVWQKFSYVFVSK